MTNATFMQSVCNHLQETSGNQTPMVEGRRLMNPSRDLLDTITYNLSEIIRGKQPMALEPQPHTFSRISYAGVGLSGGVVAF